MILLRSLPGMNKDQVIEKFVDMGYIHIQAEQWYERNPDKERNNANRNEAHCWCQAQAKAALMCGEKIIIANTFTQRWETNAYVTIANNEGVDYKIISLLDKSSPDMSLEVVIERLRKFRPDSTIPAGYMSSLYRRWERLPEEVVFNYDGITIPDEMALVV